MVTHAVLRFLSEAHAQNFRPIFPIGKRMKTNTCEIPKIGLGTYGLLGSEGTDAILSAIEIGFRHLDTAQSYDTEKPVGRAIKTCGLDRSDLFITTKISPENFTDLRASLRQSCDRLNVDHVNLTLIHWPAHYDETPVSDYIGDLAKAQSDGLTKLIGVSNFTRKHLRDVDAALGPGKLATNQFECHAYLQNRTLVDYCHQTGLQVTAYMPLAAGKLAKDPVLKEIAERKDAEASQVALAFLLAQGHVVIPKSADLARLASNYAASTVALTAADITQIQELERNDRIVDPKWGPDWD